MADKIERWTVTYMKPEYRPEKWYVYWVTGTGKFPFDMLRFDRCWPVDGESAAALDDSGRRSVQLKSFQEPTVGRWGSFMWSVGKEKIYEGETSDRVSEEGPEEAPKAH